MDRREYSRAIFRSYAELTAADLAAAGDVTDLSMNGMFVATDRAIPAGADVTAEIRLTGANSKLSIRCRGRVARCGDSGVAVTFEDMDLDSFVHLKHLVSYASGDPQRVARDYESYARRRMMDPA